MHLPRARRLLAFIIVVNVVIYIACVISFGGLQSEKKLVAKRRVHEPNETLSHAEVCRSWMCRNYDRNQLANRSLMTIVTAYFNLGSFRKGEGNEFTTETYWHWSSAYARVLTSVIFYTDDYAFARKLVDLRAQPNQRTCVCLLDRDVLWSFSLLPRIAKILTQRGYPKYHPNTVLPEYGAAMHAKYELMNIAASENVFATKYFAWADIGVFRSLVDQLQLSRVRPFELALPPNFNEHSVAYTQVDQPDFEINLCKYFTENLVWVCGCFFLAERGVMQSWTVEYRRFVDLLLHIGLSSIDQTVLYSMKNHLFAFSDERSRVSVQVYRAPAGVDENLRWFFLAFLCRHEGLKLQDKLKLAALAGPLGNLSQVHSASSAQGKDEVLDQKLLMHAED